MLHNPLAEHQEAAPCRRWCSPRPTCLAATRRRCKPRPGCQPHPQPAPGRPQARPSGSGGLQPNGIHDWRWHAASCPPRRGGCGEALRELAAARRRRRRSPAAGRLTGTQVDDGNLGALGGLPAAEGPDCGGEDLETKQRVEEHPTPRRGGRQQEVNRAQDGNRAGAAAVAQRKENSFAAAGSLGKGTSLQTDASLPFDGVPLSLLAYARVPELPRTQCSVHRHAQLCT